MLRLRALRKTRILVAFGCQSAFEGLIGSIDALKWFLTLWPVKVLVAASPTASDSTPLNQILEVNKPQPAIYYVPNITRSGAWNSTKAVSCQFGTAPDGFIFQGWTFSLSKLVRRNTRSVARLVGLLGALHRCR
jgi:hypothetical protein